MTEDRIERIVERRIDRLDAWYMTPNSTLTAAEYEAAIKAVCDWADNEYRRNRWRPVE